MSDLSSTILAERATALDTDHASQEGLDAALGARRRGARRRGRRAPAGDRRRARAARSGRPGRRRRRLVGDPPRLGRRAGRQEMRRRLDVPVLVDNDANLGALGEAVYGAGQGARRLRLRQGLLRHRRGADPQRPPLPRAGTGWRASSATSLVDPKGAVCRCGNRGCLETAASAPAVLRAAAAQPRRRSPSRTCSRLAREGDLGCRRVIADAGRAVGGAAALLCNILNPRRIVVGGDLAAAGDLLLDGVRESVRRFALPAAADAAEVVAGVLGERAEVLGALALVDERGRRPGPDADGDGAVGRSSPPGVRHVSSTKGPPGMFKGRFGAFAVAAALALTVGACGGDDEPAGGGGGGGESEEADGNIGVILPDAASSARWETATASCSARRSRPPGSSTTSRTPTATRRSSPRSPTRCSTAARPC